ncbi:CPBP family intramembrane metalloprotease [Rhodocytophaga rosea]|uniref:CPBP family intramembrane metalloprotease n=1 Tax=Rhodocytophaga rosea TaxID=2704465 RepID=A0A6C0GHN5_9BACT|nr:type II CAAX endopeptidase family protein [Rhodocytophaga rosea]QHT67581.1 CPBP family intramembrane metalloprotease [Rhodocytophaga rosea]
MKNREQTYWLPIACFIALAYALSWLIWFPLYASKLGIQGLPILPYHHALGAIGPFAAAFITTYIFHKENGVQELISRLFRWKVGIQWHLIVWLGPFVLLVLALFIESFSQGKAIELSGIGISREFPKFGLIVFTLYNIFSFGYGEETGWRGFLLPRLQSRYDALWGSIILTFIWAGWHIPLFLYRPGYTSMEMADSIGWLLSLFTGSILLTWIFNSTRGSIIIVSIFHAIIDVAFTSTAAQGEISNYMGMLITVWAIIILWMYKPKNISDKPAFVISTPAKQSVEKSTERV